jgi:hypothetical protein
MKTFTIEYENDELDYRFLKQRFIDAGADEKTAQSLASEYSKHLQCEYESF